MTVAIIIIIIIITNINCANLNYGVWHAKRKQPLGWNGSSLAPNSRAVRPKETEHIRLPGWQVKYIE